MVGQTKTTSVPTGDLNKAYISLLDKYEPKDTMSKIDLVHKYDNLKLTDFQDCDKWISQMNNLRQILKINHNRTYDDDKFIYNFYTNLPEGLTYAVLNPTLNFQITDPTYPLTLQRFRDQLRNFIRDNKLQRENHALSATGSTFNNIQYREFVQRGIHRSNFSKNNNNTINNNNNNNNINTNNNSNYNNNSNNNSHRLPCDHCGKGHPTSRCWSQMTCSLCRKKVHPMSFCSKNINNPWNKSNNQHNSTNNTSTSNNSSTECSYCSIK